MFSGMKPTLECGDGNLYGDISPELMEIGKNITGVQCLLFYIKQNRISEKFMQT